MNDDEAAEPTTDTVEDGRLDRHAQAQLLRQWAGRYADLARHQSDQAERAAPANRWIAGRYANAAKANDRLGKALAEHARQLLA